MPASVSQSTSQRGDVSFPGSERLTPREREVLQLIAEGNSYKEIASALHFADAAVFSRAFRSWSKTNPREWRARREPNAVPRADEPGQGTLSRPV